MRGFYALAILVAMIFCSCGDSGSKDKCASDCEGRECGPGPNCGESCGTCDDGFGCSPSGQCTVEDCLSDCSNQECGLDPICGRSCGTCPNGTNCDSSGQCQPVPPWEPDTYTVQCSDGVCFIPAGAFGQGCNESYDYDCSGHEGPYHQVNVPDFEIDQYQVTVDMYGDCVDAGVCSEPLASPTCNWDVPGSSDLPINCITWDQAHEYCQWSGRRLCSESEWEKAARGTDGRVYPWGNAEASCDYAVMKNEMGAGCGTSATMDVGSKPDGASPYGVLDMAGNVWEWVEDDWHDSYDGAPGDGRPWIDTPRNSDRIFRGGCFINDGSQLRASNRRQANQDDSTDSLGTRCCRSR